jgi:predicted nucleic acid-binding protein
MRYLLDTNVISEASKPRPDPGVAAWMRSQSPMSMGISVLTLGEIRKGVELLPTGGRRSSLEAWLSTDLPRQFHGRILPVDEEVAAEWGRMLAEAKSKRRDCPSVDALLLATAGVHDLTFVTRNERHCAGRGVPIFNPWAS